MHDDILAMKADLVDDWVARTEEVGLTSMLTGNEPRFSKSLPSEVDVVTEPCSRINARLGRLRRRSQAVVAALSATTITSIDDNSLCESFTTARSEIGSFDTANLSLSSAIATPATTVTTVRTPPTAFESTLKATPPLQKKARMESLRVREVC